MTELFNKIDAKLNTINYITKSPTIERNVTKIKKYISKLKRIVEETNDAITNVSGYNEELLDKIADQKFEINELKEENAEIIVRLNDLENENIGLKSRQINVERRRKKKNKRKTKHKHEKRLPTQKYQPNGIGYRVLQVIELYLFAKGSEGYLGKLKQLNTQRYTHYGETQNDSANSPQERRNKSSKNKPDNVSYLSHKAPS